MNQSKLKKKKPNQLHIPVSYEHDCRGEYMPIANVVDITPENILRREAKKGHEMSE